MSARVCEIRAGRSLNSYSELENRLTSSAKNDLGQLEYIAIVRLNRRVDARENALHVCAKVPFSDFQIKRESAELLGGWTSVYLPSSKELYSSN